MKYSKNEIKEMIMSLGYATQSGNYLLTVEAIERIAEKLGEADVPWFNTGNAGLSNSDRSWHESIK